MKQKQLIFCMGLSAIALLSSCNEREFDVKPSDGQDNAKMGKLVLDLTADASFSEQTRALNESDYTNTANYTVQLLKGGEVEKECLYSQIEDVFPKELEPGDYTIKAFFGSDVPYSRNEFRVEGHSDFNVGKGTESRVSVNCFPTCGKLTVVFDESMPTYYDAYNVSYSGATAFSGGFVAWGKNDVDPLYVKVAEDGEELTYTIRVTAKEEYAHVDADGNKQTSGQVTGKFTLTRNHGHKLTVKPNYIPTSEGGLSIEVTIDDTVNEHKETIVVPVNWL